jgi:hypothetical protein
VRYETGPRFSVVELVTIEPGPGTEPPSARKTEGAAPISGMFSDVTVDVFEEDLELR